jgi:hypothetical protein
MKSVLLFSRSPIFRATVNGWTLADDPVSARKHRIAIEPCVSSVGSHTVGRQRIGGSKLNGLIAAGLSEGRVNAA